MSQSVITTAFEQLKAQQAANGGVLTLDEFVFANIPNLNITDPIDRAESWPAASQIVHRQAVSKTGMVNNNAVVYSVVLGADVGDFDFNWVGLINKASNTVAMIVHAPLQKKIKTAAGQQGNVLTRSFLMEYDGASQQTQIITPVDTWQIDFTARLGGVDERQRQENIDVYGAAAFLGNGWLVTKKSSTKFSVQSGVGYIAGLRAELLASQEITVNAKPTKIWVDVCWRGTLTSAWASVSKITVAPDLVNYNESGVQHYVFALAEIDATGAVKDLRNTSNVTALAGLKPEASSLIQFDGDSKLALSPLAEFMRQFLAIDTAASAVKALGLADAAGFVGRIVSVNFYQASKKITRSPGVKKYFVIITGGGASGGTQVGNSLYARSGGAGGTRFALIDASNLEEVQITIGAGGLSLAPTTTYAHPGNPGGDSTFGSLLTAKGGTVNSLGGGTEGLGFGFDGGCGTIGSNQATYTGGGASFWGGGGVGPATDAALHDGRSPGSGGAGISLAQSRSGRGADGCCLVVELG